MTVLHVLVPLANEVHQNDRVFLRIGPNTQRRIDDLCAWSSHTFQRGEHVWALGAGADLKHESGPTLAALMERYLTEECGVSDVITNYRDIDAYGTVEEMAWVIAKAHVLYPEHELRFVFGTQPRHLARVKCIVRLFHPKINAVFVPTGYVRQIPMWHEALAYAKLASLKLGFKRFVRKLRRSVSLRVDKA